jgi:DNA-binding CsgD family transcriptional regulator
MRAARRAQLDCLGIIEAGYAWHPRDEDWLQGIAQAACGLASSTGVSARLDDVSDDERPRTLAAAFDRDAERPRLDALSERLASLPPALRRTLFEPGPAVGFARDRVRSLPAREQALLAETFASLGWLDVLGIYARDVSGQLLHVDIAVTRRERLHPRTLHRLACVAAHLTSALRLRLAGPPAPDAPSTEAVLEPSGAVRHAVRDASRRSVRARLTRAVRELDVARGTLRRSDPDASLALWKGLVDGTWSLVDHWDGDGRRFVLARRNAPHVADPKALTVSERAIVAFLAMGHPVKYVAYLLGLSPSTVATQFALARRKLGVRSREGLVDLFAPRAGNRSPERKHT